jgi:hypothetical protein
MNDFEALFGIDAIKESLIDELALILDRSASKTGAGGITAAV